MESAHHRVLEIDPKDPRARAALAQYLTEVAEQIAEPVVSSAEADLVEEFRPPHGMFLVVTADDEVIGCGALRTIHPGVGEIKRMWIRQDARGRGLGALLLETLEKASVRLGHETVRLDTNNALTEATHLYESRGYRSIERFNENPDATDFYEKRLI